MFTRPLTILAIVVFVGSLSVGGTGAFFSDIETSTNNSFTAGALDLQVDNTSYYNGDYSEHTSWQLADLDDGEGPSTDEGAYLFFNFLDLKPGDWGEDTISLHVHDNPSYACMQIDVTAEDDNGLTAPEALVDTTDGVGEGELQEEIHFAWWLDDGDNVLETGEDVRFGDTTLAQLDGLSVPIADTSEDSLLDAPLNSDGVKTYYLAKAWCFGDFTLNPVAQDDQGFTAAVGGNGPDVRHSGITCSGAGASNRTQTDSVELDVSFSAIQARHNEAFVCAPSTVQGGDVEEQVVVPTLSTSTSATSTSVGVSYESFKNAPHTDAPDEVVLGTVPFVGPGHATQDLTWLAGTNTVSVVFDQAADTLTSIVNGGVPLVYHNVAAHASCPVAQWDVLQVYVKEENGADVVVHGLTVDGSSFSDLIGNKTGNYWHITGLSLSDGFSAVANVVLSGTFNNNGSGNVVQLSVGCGA